MQRGWRTRRGHSRGLSQKQLQSLNLLLVSLATTAGRGARAEWPASQRRVGQRAAFSACWICEALGPRRALSQPSLVTSIWSSDRAPAPCFLSSIISTAVQVDPRSLDPSPLSSRAVL